MTSLFDRKPGSLQTRSLDKSPSSATAGKPLGPHRPRALLGYLGALFLLHDDPGQEDHPDGHGGLDCKEGRGIQGAASPRTHSGTCPSPTGGGRRVGRLGCPSSTSVLLYLWAFPEPNSSDPPCSLPSFLSVPSFPETPMSVSLSC